MEGENMPLPILTLEGTKVCILLYQGPENVVALREVMEPAWRDESIEMESVLLALLQLGLYRSLDSSSLRRDEKGDDMGILAQLMW